MTTRSRWLIASAVFAVAVYLLLWVGYAQRWPWQSALDSALLEPLYRFGSTRPGWVTAWDVYCTVFGPTVFRLLGLVLLVVALVRRRVRTAMFLVGTVELSGILTEIAKAAADRPRPDTAFVSALSTSFPSGHAVGVLISVLALLTVAWGGLTPARRRWLAALGAVVVVTIGLGRVVLNVHHPSDVLAGWVLGYAWFVLWLLAVRPVRAADETPAARDTAR
jgi:undecaprenyl-diphosphatase